MMKLKMTICALVLAGGMTLSPHGNSLIAQEKPKNEKLDATAQKKLQAKVEKNLDSLSYHAEFIKQYDLEQPEVFKIYNSWISKHPKNVSIPYAFGTALGNASSPKAKEYLLKAVALNPKLKEAYAELWSDASRWGDEELARMYLEKIIEIDPDDANYSFYYASSLKNVDKAKHRELSLAVAKKFNKSERGAQALYWLGHAEKDPVRKEAVYKQLKNDFPPKDFGWSSSGMSAYNDLLCEQERFEESKSLCEELFKTTGEKNWQASAATALTLEKFKAAKDNKEWDKALDIIGAIKVTRYEAIAKRVPIMIAEVTALNGNNEASYKMLMDAYVKSPSLGLKESLHAQGKKLSKTTATVQQEITQNLKNNSQVATAFDLKNYSGGSNSLKDFEGKVTFITYWYPGCGPCRGEFPHFENVVKKFSKEQLAYIGINIVSSQNDYVLPFMKTSGYSFLPLEDFKGREKGNMDNRNAAPVNFLIDKKGNLIFSNFRTDAHNEDELELMINEILAL